MNSPSGEVHRRRGLTARAAYLTALALGYGAVLAADLPGHLTLDSLVELYEGRFRIRQSWAPSFYAWVLGRFDAAATGTALYVMVSGLTLFAALASLPWLTGRASRWSWLAAGLFSASPLVLIYQGIVWKDVLFANTAIAGMIGLAWAVRTQRPPVRAAALALALGFLAAATLLRQNGILVGLFGAAALGVAMSGGRLRRGVAWSLAALVSVIVVSHALNLATQPGDPGSGDGVPEGLRVLQSYDLLGALAHDPRHPLPALHAANAQSEAVLRTVGARSYSAERTDVTDAEPQIRAALDAVPAEAIASDWRALVLRRPDLYLRERLEVFRWVFLTPSVERCLPVALGVQGPIEVRQRLGLAYRWDERDEALLHYDRAFLQSPVHAHLAYAVLAALVAAVLLARGRREDLVMAALMAAALAFAASFFVISIACDYRYLYFLDLTAMCGALYLALDPPRLIRRRTPLHVRRIDTGPIDTA